ncbi:MAG: ribbon-helix-helix domain-containing protein [Chloroflexi bacterium]|nr:ribbon-helix-helix domain-containing protein [Chloroflexota bacterium]
MTRKDKTKPRFSVGLTPDQSSRLDEIQRTRSRKGETTNRSALVREAVGFYLQHQPDLVGSRKAIAKDLEGKIDALDEKLEDLRAQFAAFVESVTRRRTGG